MTKEVLVSIRGLQVTEDEKDDTLEVITSATYYKKNGKHYIIYDEVMEGFTEKTKNIIKLNDDMLDITKRGVSNVHMMFEKDKKNVTYYYTPYGSLLVGTYATKIEVEESEHQMEIKVDYALEVNYEHLADCTIVMKVQSKDGGEFHIS